MEDKLNKKYKKLKLIGVGTFGKAWLVSSCHSGRSYVIKEITLTGMSVEEKSQAENEAAILSRLKHKNVIRYREAFTSTGLLHIVMEHADQGDLAERIEHRRVNSGVGFPEEQTLDWIVQIGFALNYIHRQKILHRDLKPANIFLTSSRLLKIGDFGIAKMLSNTVDHARTAIGTPYYLSPEICRRQPYNQKSDMWALGCILYELVTLKHPFQAKDFSGLVLNILSGVYPPVMSDYSLLVSDLVSVLLRVNPEKRPTAWQVLQVPKMRSHVINYTNRKNESMTSLPASRKSTTSEEFAKNESSLEIKSRKRLGGTSIECSKNVKSEYRDIRHNNEPDESSLRHEKSTREVRESKPKTVKNNRTGKKCNVKRNNEENRISVDSAFHKKSSAKYTANSTQEGYLSEDSNVNNDATDVNRSTPSVGRRGRKIHHLRATNRPSKASNGSQTTQKQKVGCALPLPMAVGIEETVTRTVRESPDKRKTGKIKCGETYVFNRRGCTFTSCKNKASGKGRQQLDGKFKKLAGKEDTTGQNVTSAETEISHPDQLPEIEKTNFQVEGFQMDSDLKDDRHNEDGFLSSCHQTVVSPPFSPNRTIEIATVMHAGTPTSDDDTGSVRGRLESLRFYLEDKLGTVNCVSALKCLEETTESDRLVKLMNDRIGSSKMRYFPVLLQMWDLENRCH